MTNNDDKPEVFIHSIEDLKEAMNMLIKEGKKFNSKQKVGTFKGYDKDGNAIIDLDQEFLNRAFELLSRK